MYFFSFFLSFPPISTYFVNRGENITHNKNTHSLETRFTRHSLSAVAVGERIDTKRKDIKSLKMIYIYVDFFESQTSVKTKLIGCGVIEFKIKIFNSNYLLIKSPSRIPSIASVYSPFSRSTADNMFFWIQSKFKCLNSSICSIHFESIVTFFFARLVNDFWG